MASIDPRFRPLVLVAWGGLVLLYLGLFFAGMFVLYRQLITLLADFDLLILAHQMF